MAALKETIAMVFMANGGAIAEVATTAEIQLQHAALHAILHANPCACDVYSSALLLLLHFFVLQ